MRFSPQLLPLWGCLGSISVENMTELDRLRQEIDHIDNQLVDLLATRMEIVRQVGLFKRQNNAIIYRPEREKAILDRLALRKRDSLLTPAAIDAVFMEIFAISRNYELPERVAYLGPEGSFSHQAAESRFGLMSDYMPLQNLRSVFESVITERARFGVVPIENNQEGFVRETIDLLHELPVKLVAEILLPVHHAFVSQGDRLGDVHRIYSREIAFKQCRNFLHNYFENATVELVPVESTSKAAQLAAQDPNGAAICSSVAAKLYRVPILFENIEDSPHNRTRFWVISRSFENVRSGNDKTTIVVNLPDVAGSLAEFLQDFNHAGINLNKIESRPLRDGDTFKNWFYIECDGHYQDEILASIFTRHADKVRVLGSCVKLT